MSTSEYITKHCNNCGNEYPLTDEFWHKDKNSRNGFCAYCKECNKARARKHRADNLQQYREYDKARRLADPEKKRQSDKRWREKNIDKKRQMDKEYYYKQKEENPELLREKGNIRSKRWYYKDIERSRELGRNQARKHSEKRKPYRVKYRHDNVHMFRGYSKHRNARKSNAEGSHTFREVMILFREQEGYCFHCRADLILIGYHEDHWQPLSRGGSDYIENIRLLCPFCNLSKHNKLPCEWSDRYG